MDEQSIRIAVDIGGTFTDGVAQRASDQRIWVAKTLTTPEDPGAAVVTVVNDLIARAQGDGPGVCVHNIIHGTTLVANALIERRGARTALVVTRGTRDVPDIGRELRYDLYDLWLKKPLPLVAVQDRFEVVERMDAAGDVLTKLDESDLAQVCQKVAAGNYETVAVCLLHGYANDAHELRVQQALRVALPGVHVTVSSQVAREMREYERMSTAAANAYVQPMMARYLRTLGARLNTLGADTPLEIMISSGGFTSTEAAGEVPIQLLESGPAGGVLSAADTARRCAVDDVLAFDMGGTTAKACVALGCNPSMTHHFEAARVHRFKRGSGLPIMIPSLDLIEIGAGGGSIASTDALGLLKVGPRSAGSEPGPACYGRGGQEATVTDADLVLGYLSPDRFLGGDMVLQPERSRVALQALAQTLNMTTTSVAWGIVDIVNENMAAAARIHIAEKGYDPRQFAMVATGGAGPVHAVEVAAKLRLRRVLLPVAAGAGSCLGLLGAPARAHRSWSRPQLLSVINWPEIQTIVSRLRQEASAELRQATTPDEPITWELTVEMRYAGQGHDVAVALPSIDIDASSADVVAESFRQRYVALYGREVPDAEAQCITWRVSGRARERVSAYKLPLAERPDSLPREQRPIYIPTLREFRDVPVFERGRLSPNVNLEGPLIIEERESTAVIACPAEVRVLADHTIEIVLPEAAA